VNPLGAAALCDLLVANDIPYERYDHAPVFTCEQTERFVPAAAGGIQTKNLFLRDKHGKRHWLCVTSCDKQIDLKGLGDLIGAQRPGFASADRLTRFLGVTPGSVTLLALAYEGAKDVEVWIDADIWDGSALRCHPLTNTATLVMSPEAIQRFLSITGHTPTMRVFPSRAPSDLTGGAERDE
jgi:Ala-tRNA(Pro) deacylase